MRCAAIVKLARRLLALFQMNCHARRLECVALAPALRQRQQAGRTPNASRSLVAAVPRCVLCLSLGFLSLSLNAADTWQSALGRMPLGTNITQLNRSNCVGIRSEERR